MAQHVINIAFDFDDEKVKTTAENTIDKEMHKIVKDAIYDRLAPIENSWYSSKNERNWSRFNNKIDDQIREFIDDHKEEVIERAASKVAESVKRTKAWKDKFGEATADV